MCTYPIAMFPVFETLEDSWAPFFFGDAQSGSGDRDASAERSGDRDASAESRYALSEGLLSEGSRCVCICVYAIYIYIYNIDSRHALSHMRSTAKAGVDCRLESMSEKKKCTYIDRRGCSGSLSNEGAVTVIWGLHALPLRAHTIVA